jgi:hypothetical protein
MSTRQKASLVSALAAGLWMLAGSILTLWFISGSL